MKKVLVIVSLVLSVCSCTTAQTPKFLIAGSGSDSIAVLDRETKTVEWAYAIPKGGECNCAVVTKEGNVLFSYSKGARLVDFEGNTIWDFPKEEEDQEIQTAIQTADGGYMLAACGFPAKFIFLNSKGEKTNETEFDTKIPGRHSQFRQVRFSKYGTILIPFMGNGHVFEIDPDGVVLNQFRAGGGLFSLEELSDGNLLVSGGSGVAEFDRNTGTKVAQIVKDSLPGVKFAFPTQSQRLPNGHTVLSNWQGHEQNPNQASLVELDAEGREVWLFDGCSTVKFISSVYYFEN